MAGLVKTLTIGMAIIALLMFAVVLLGGPQSEHQCERDPWRLRNELYVPTDCLEWAFGKDWAHTKTSGRDELWNEKHSDLFVVHGTDDYDLSMAKIYVAWREKE